MAMAEVFLPEVLSTTVEDLSISFPRAPPPSPEMQPRGNSGVFEIPASKFEGIGLDLRRDTFPLDEEEEDEHPLHLRKQLGSSSVPFGNSSMFSELDIYEDDFVACSPRKRVCCAASTTVPRDHMITTFPSSQANSLASSGFGSLHDIAHKEEEGANFGMGFTNGTGADSMSAFPMIFSSGPQIQSKPHLIPPRSEGGIPTLREPPFIVTPTVSPLHAPLSDLADDHHHYNLLSRSCDLHTTHPHLPHSFEATQLPEARPTRSRTLDSASLHKTLLPCPQTSEDNQDTGQRKRKVSIKRKNPEESESDSGLQFSFDYSYSSTGSSGESDWVLVDMQTESSWPLEKKACSVHHSSVLAHSMQHQYAFDSSAGPSSSSSARTMGIGSGGRERAGAIDMPPQDATISSPFSQFLNSNVQLEMGVSKAEDNTPTQHQCMDLSAMTMDWGRQSEDMEVDLAAMDCGNNMRTTLAGSHDSDNTIMSPVLLRPHLQYPQASGGGHTHELLPVPVRHSCMESRSVSFWRSQKEVQLDTDMETRLNLSKSL